MDLKVVNYCINPHPKNGGQLVGNMGTYNPLS
jgi:hypothetical protein